MLDLLYHAHTGITSVPCRLLSRDQVTVQVVVGQQSRLLLIQRLAHLCAQAMQVGQAELVLDNSTLPVRSKLRKVSPYCLLSDFRVCRSKRAA